MSQTVASLKDHPKFKKEGFRLVLRCDGKEVQPNDTPESLSMFSGDSLFAGFVEISNDLPAPITSSTSQDDKDKEKDNEDRIKIVLQNKKLQRKISIKKVL